MSEPKPPPDWMDHRHFRCRCTYVPDDLGAGLKLISWNKRCPVHTGLAELGQAIEP